LSPPANTKFGAQVFKENGIPAVHPNNSVAGSLT
jgi:hypothetical protein